MSTFLHVLEVVSDKCKGRLACVRACPTEAIRFRNGKVSINPMKCIYCGDCIVACPEGAIQARTDPWESVKDFEFKVAVVSPSLFGQFPRSITPFDIVKGLLAIGFDAVYDLSLESEIYNRAVQDYLAEYTGPLPLISSNCPVIVRLVQVSYPDMVDQIIPLQPPREIGGREAKRKYSQRLGIPQSKVGAIYITPCPAKTASIKQPAEGVKSHLDLGLSIRDIYNPLLSAITRNKKSSGVTNPVLPESELRSKLYLGLALTGGLSYALKQGRYITVAQLPSIIKVIEDIEKGKIRSIDFLECYSCMGGCIGGPLTVDDLFVARSKLEKVIEMIGRENRNMDEVVDQVYVKGDYFFEQPLKPRHIEPEDLSITEQVQRVKTREKFISMLPGIDCALCGCPSCSVFANDVAGGEASPKDCPLLSSERLESLRKIYKISGESGKTDGRNSPQEP